MKVFITGEKGLVATELAKYLSSLNDIDVVWSYNYRIEDLCLFDSMWGKGTELDVTDCERLLKALGETNPDVVINLAGCVGTDVCSLNKVQAVKSNILGAFNVAYATNKLDIKLIHFSTTAIFDPDDYDGYLITNNTKKVGKTHYGKTKLLGEEMVRCENPDAIIVRPTFVFGGVEDRHSAIAKIINTVFTKSSTDVLLDPIIKKDYMHINDFVESIYYVITKGICGTEYNISKGEPVPFGDVVLTIQSVVDRNMYFSLYPELDYLKNHIVDNYDIVRLGWKPKLSLREGIEMTYNDFKKQLEG